MGITDIFKNSNEKKLIDELKKCNHEALQQDLEEYRQFERMRQTWSYEGKSGLYHKIKEHEDVANDIDKIIDDKGYNLISKKEIYRRYINYIKYFKENYSKEDKYDSLDEYENNFNIFVNLGQKFSNDFKGYKEYLGFVLKNRNVTKREQTGIISLIDKIESQLENINTSTKKLKEIILKGDLELEKDKKHYWKIVDEVQNWMYGKNNFCQKILQEIFNRYKKVYDLILKCKDKKKLEIYFKKLNNNDRVNVNVIFSTLAMVAIEIYNRENKYTKKFTELQICFSVS